MNCTSETLLKLLRIALGHESDSSIPSGIDWRELITLSYKHGISAIAVDGFLKIYDRNSESGIDKPEYENLKYEWLGNSLLAEQTYSEQKSAIVKLANFYKNQEVKMLLLKGYGLSLNYPVPIHRPVGDIDIYNFGLWDLADQMVEKRLGIKVDRSHEHHTVFIFDGFAVENHYDIVNTKLAKSSVVIDAKLKQLAEQSHECEDGFYLPSSDFNAIFLIRHLGQHMAGDRATLRQLLDWGLFIDKHSDEINWKFISGYWKEMGIAEFAKCINSICVEHLGIEADKFHGELSVNKELCNRLLNDILNPEFTMKCPNGSAFKTAVFKTRRFIANGWKRKLVYKEGLFELFVTGAFAKVKRRNVEDVTLV